MKEYIEFEDVTLQGWAVKTKFWYVNKKGSTERLGIICWHGAWRQYIFVPEEDTIWSAGCLKTVMMFLNKANEDFRKKHKRGVR